MTFESPINTVRNLTTAPRQIPIDIEGTVAFEIILTIWSVLNPKETNTTFSLGHKWAEDVKESIPEDLGQELAEIGGPWCMAWLAISALLTTAPHPHDPDHLFEWLEGIGDNRLRRHVVGYTTESADPAVIEQLAGGDTDAIPAIMATLDHPKPEFAEFLQWLATNEGLPQRYARALREFRATAFAKFEKEFGGAIARAAAARRATPATGSAREVVEEVTAGIEFDIPIGVTRVVLVPSVVTRPLSLLVGHRETLVVYYAVAEEFIDSDPDAPPSWLVNTFKALGDERRLRILRRLMAGPTSLDDLTEMLGMSKSTVHHHVTQLRGAGLVRVKVGADAHSGSAKKYTIRTPGFVNAMSILESYLGPNESEENVS